MNIAALRRFVRIAIFEIACPIIATWWALEAVETMFGHLCAVLTGAAILTTIIVHFAQIFCRGFRRGRKCARKGRLHS